MELRDPVFEGKRFGFTVEWHDGYSWDFDESTPDGYSVRLPHQCDAWEIAGEKYESPVPKEQAIEDLRQFIDEATLALVALIEAEVPDPQSQDGTEGGMDA